MNAMAHGMMPGGLSVPHGEDAPAGRFGRMFPALPARKPAGLGLAERFGLPGGLMDGGETTTDQENPGLPAGFTYFGQLIDHNTTFDPTSQLDQDTDPLSLTDFRPPRLDLANVYGTGPVAQPYLYDPDSRGTKIATSANGVDVVRTSEHVALIGDPRNDENLLLSQLHLAFVKFHNALVDLLAAGTITDVNGDPLPPRPPAQPPVEDPGVPIEELLSTGDYYGALFSKAQQLARWHYQWIIVHEYLPLIGDPVVVRDIERNGPEFFRPGDRAFMPVEFSVAGFRAVGHPTVRSSYQVNDGFEGKIFPDNPGAPALPRTDLRGGIPVDAAHAVDFSFFFPLSPARVPQSAKKFQSLLNRQLLDLPVSAVPGSVTGGLARPLGSLAVRNLLRSEVLELPSGQDVARKVGVVPLTDDQLGTEGPIYLWFYLLKEAEILGGGLSLGPVGTRIVAETLIGLLDSDSGSYRSAYSAWRPTLADGSGEFGITDLLRIAGVG
ncbi:MAG TPA: heme peroxidase family protein [Trebonia sp.]|jgi:hypothetical protein